MKQLFFFCLFISSFSYGQILSGDLKEEGRTLISDSSYVIQSHVNGFVTYELTVDREGNVTATRIVEDKTTVKSTPARMQVRNYVKELKFQAGTHYPKYQTAVVRITTVKPQ